MLATTLIALMRGINVGRAKRVAMADLRALIEGLGYSDVCTLLNSGNIVFKDPDSAPDEAGARIEESIEKRFGFSSRVTILTGSEMAAIVRDNPLLDVAENQSRLIVAVLATPEVRARIVPLTEQDWDPDVLALGSRVAYLWCRNGVLASRLPEALECGR
ncbi:MAG: hypothetical protein DRJ65_12000 [Acidobacteria bacterium]|nr:MAG: hypothetical protein DRJ65_12000 [Acidobacteriota bacterium]